MHLDTVFTAVDVDKFTYYPGIMGGLKLYELTLGSDGELRVSCAEEELDEALKRLLHLPAVDLIPCAGGDPFWADYDQSFRRLEHARRRPRRGVHLRPQLAHERCACASTTSRCSRFPPASSAARAAAGAA